tara:strand:+ start:336 stop:797 length:462 start_codon:yes stop_codon:yes gene_type:complete
MGLKSNLENACIKHLGDDAVNSGNCSELAKDQTDAIVDWITKQTFRIVEMKAILEVEKFQTSAPYEADVLSTVMASPGIGVMTSGGGGATTSPGPLQGTQKGILIPKANFSKTGGTGGALKSKGYSYIGNNPVGETNEKKTKVKLLKEDLTDL